MNMTLHTVSAGFTGKYQPENWPACLVGYGVWGCPACRRLNAPFGASWPIMGGIKGLGWNDW